MRVIDHWHTATMTGKVPELQKANPAAYVEINPQDAEKAGIRQDDTVIVETRRAPWNCRPESATSAVPA